MQRHWLLSHKWTLFRITLLSVLYSFTIIIQAFSIVQIIDIVFIEQQQLAATLQHFIWLIGAMIGRLITQYAIDQFGSQLSFDVKQTIRAQLLSRWKERALQQQLSKQSGEQVSLFIQTVDELHPYYHDYIPQVIKSTIVPLVILGTIFFTHANSGWIMLITAPFIPLTYIIVGLQTKHKAEQQLTAMNRFSGTFLDLLQGIQTIRLFRQQRQKAEMLQASNAQFLRTTMDVLKIAFASTLFIELITTLGIGLVALEIGFQMIVFKALLFAPAFFVLILAPEYYNTLKQLGSAFHTAKGSEGAFSLLTEELQQPISAISWGQQQMPHKPSLSLQNVSVNYDNGPTIGPLSFTVPSGKTVAIIGPTGHGKSTTLNVLAAALSHSGQYFINGRERHEFEANSFYEQLVFISQRTYIFAGTLRDNLRMGAHLEDEVLLKGLEKAQLLPWFHALPEGLDTVIGEGGRGLSGGEQQRIAIARAFIKQPSIVLFDEPTANLDAETEQLIRHGLQTLSEHATTVIVSHRYESIQFADYIYVVENGKIVDEGAPNILMHPLYINMKGGTGNAKGSNFGAEKNSSLYNNRRYN